MKIPQYFDLYHGIHMTFQDTSQYMHDFRHVLWYFDLQHGIHVALLGISKYTMVQVQKN